MVDSKSNFLAAQLGSVEQALAKLKDRTDLSPEVQQLVLDAAVRCAGVRALWQIGDYVSGNTLLAFAARDTGLALEKLA